MKIENAEQALVEILNKAVEVGDFMTEQAPLVVQELLLYKTFEHAMTAIILLVILALMVKPAKWSLGESRSGEHYDPSGYAFLFGACCVVSLFLFIGAIGDIMSFAKVIIAPRLYLLEYAAELVRQA